MTHVKRRVALLAAMLLLCLPLAATPAASDDSQYSPTYLASSGVLRERGSCGPEGEPQRDPSSNAEVLSFPGLEFGYLTTPWSTDAGGFAFCIETGGRYDEYDCMSSSGEGTGQVLLEYGGIDRSGPIKKHVFDQLRMTNVLGGVVLTGSYHTFRADWDAWGHYAWEPSNERGSIVATFPWVSLGSPCYFNPGQITLLAEGQ